jgi:Fe2+ transport system protein FeoA
LVLRHDLSNHPERPGHPCTAHCLCCLPVGRIGTVLAVTGDDNLATRLVDLGFWPGAQVTKVLVAPFGDPLLFEVHGYRLALRRDEARRIQLAAA